MLNYILTDVKNRETRLKQPLSVSIVFSEDAPAASLTAVFAVSGKVPLLLSVRVMDGNDTVFFGYIDEQTEITRDGSLLLQIGARSREAVLLDNEAHPQTYCMPSMPLLVDRHFRKFGLTEYIGTDKAFNGELIIKKGMSEWEVLSSFCEKFLKTVPHLSIDGIIDISGEDRSSLICIGGSNKLLSVRRSRKRRMVISDIFARTCISGGYEMHLKNEAADAYAVQKVRYVNSIDSEGKTINTAKQIITDTNHAYESYIIECSGSVIGAVGDRLRLEGRNFTMKINELHYVLGSEGEKTRIYAEVIG